MHKSVLLNESIAYLNLHDDSLIVDSTLGYGGHSAAILSQIPRGFLIAIDQDQVAIAHSKNRLAMIADNYEIIYRNFGYLEDILAKRGINGVDGILFDLGVSSPQLDEQERGFSFHHDAALDMRMDQNNPLTAYQVVNTYPYEQLVRLFREYGEEKYAVSIAKGIIKSREKKAIATTLELVEVIAHNVPIQYKLEKHPARKVFQAIRIEVNNELAILDKALRAALAALNVHGRLCVITFHSLEDRLCKNIFKEYSEVDKMVAKLPIVPTEYEPKYRVIANIEPSQTEIDANKRSRSARLRVIERIKR